MAYDVNIPSKDAKILPGIHPYFGVRLKAKLLLFSPKPGMLLGSISITLLLYLLQNVSNFTTKIKKCSIY